MIAPLNKHNKEKVFPVVTPLKFIVPVPVALNLSPFKPVNPVGPISPVGPAGPVEPTEPIDPVGPIAPVFPSNPTTLPISTIEVGKEYSTNKDSPIINNWFIYVPVSPLIPVGPNSPVGPVGPAAPVTPVAPVVPRDPVTPVLPVGPGEPVTPRAPVGPCGIEKFKIAEKEFPLLFTDAGNPEGSVVVVPIWIDAACPGIPGAPPIP